MVTLEIVECLCIIFDTHTCTHTKLRFTFLFHVRVEITLVQNSAGVFS